MDFDTMRQELSALYSQTRRPSVDPELRLRRLLVGYFAVSGPSAARSKMSLSIWPTDGSTRHA